MHGIWSCKPEVADELNGRDIALDKHGVRDRINVRPK